MVILLILALCYPIDSWQSEILEEMQVRGYRFTNFPSIRPYALSLDMLDFLGCRLWLPNLSTDMQYDTVKVLRLKPRLFYDWSNFSLVLQPVVKFGRDSLLPNNVFMGLYAADYERAYVKFNQPYFGLFLGRERFALGPSPRYNLLLSGYSPPLDWLSYYLETKVIRLSFYFSGLDTLTCKPYEYVGDTITQIINARRYLSIRRFDFSPTSWLNFGFSEAAIFGGKDFTLSCYYFNPIVLLHTLQYNWYKDANIFFNLDARIFLKNLSVYGTLLADDFQLEPDPNNEPNHLGINLGIEVADLFIKKTFLMFEYTALTRYIYSHFRPYQRYQYYGYPLGSPYGTDYDEIYSKVLYHLSDKIDLYSQVSYVRKGSNKISSPWPIPEPREPDTYFPPDNFLSGVVQQSVSSGLGMRVYFKHFTVCDLFVGASLIKNYRYLIGMTKKFLGFSLKIDLIRL